MHYPDRGLRRIEPVHCISALFIASRGVVVIRSTRCLVQCSQTLQLGAGTYQSIHSARDFSFMEVGFDTAIASRNSRLSVPTHDGFFPWAVYRST